MTRNQIVDLVTYVVETDPWNQRPWLEHLCEMNERFCDFLDFNRDKIRKKYRSSSGSADKQDDVSSELLFAHMFLLDDRFCLVYEPLAYRCGRSPDYQVSYEQQFEFGLEVKRLRVLDIQARLENWRERVGASLSTLESPLAFEINFKLTCEANALVSLLEANEGDSIGFCKRTLVEQANNVGAVTGFKCKIPMLRGVAELRLTRPGAKSDVFASDYGGLVPVLSRGNEIMKFRDIIVYTLGQIRSGQANILCIHRNSFTHMGQDLITAMKLIMDPNSFSSVARTRHAREIWPDHDQFLEHLKCLNAVVLYGWRQIGINPPNPIWKHPSPHVTIPKQVFDYVGQMVQ
jgi:hypothetical protein